jgi:hypothetical protein
MLSSSVFVEPLSKKDEYDAYVTERTGLHFVIIPEQYTYPLDEESIGSHRVYKIWLYVFTEDENQGSEHDDFIFYLITQNESTELRWDIRDNKTLYKPTDGVVLYSLLELDIVIY